MTAPGQCALTAENIGVGANLRAEGARITGRVELRGARVPGQVGFAGARLSNPGGVALRASSSTIGELWLRPAERIEGVVNLRRARIEVLNARPDAWPETVRLDGLEYTSLNPRLPADERLALLRRDEEGHVPHAYEQLAASYRRVGDDAAARAVQLARQRRHRATLPWYARIWGLLQDVTVGYGFRPLRAAAWLIALLAAGTAVYALHHPAPLKPGEAPYFSAFFYTLDLLLPIIDLGQQGAFKPHGGYQLLSYVLILAGWILATTTLTGITRALSR
ncbi:membrane-associated oxidoreductase [Actinomadura sp. PM05-2]|uniref:Membrane-associated oxidoreductase n=1 Tax=Actinomadura parmotrematis TaxID=2864039 RepID=A0ABS7FP63_9ACTN|nr:membrane-associated oxidoreductase [Actinomadura parmotrematis]